jgi:hypothetical protein
MSVCFLDAKKRLIIFNLNEIEAFVRAVRSLQAGNAPRSSQKPFFNKFYNLFFARFLIY